VSLALRAVAFVMLLLILSVTVQQLVRQRAAAIDDTSGDLARLGVVIAEQTGRAVETIDIVLRSVADTPIGAAVGGTIDGDLLRRRIAGIRQIAGLMMVDAGGRVVAASQEPAITALPGGAARLLAQHAANAAIGLLVGEPENVGGRWTVLLTRRLDRPDGAFAGMVAAALDLTYFDDFFRDVDPSENGTIVLHRRSGEVLARFPLENSQIGRNTGDLVPFEDLLNRDGFGVGIVAGQAPGAQRIVAVRALRHFPLVVTVSAGLEGVLAPWRRQAGVVALAGIAAAGVIAALLLMLASESRRVETLLAENAQARAAAERLNQRMSDQMDERERAEAALRQAQRLEAVGQLTGGVAHDFNNLLTVVLGNVDLLQAMSEAGDGPADTILTARLERMRNAAERGAQLTDQLLAFARRQPLQPRPASLNAVIAAMHDLVQSATGGNIRVNLELQEDIWAALVDTTQIELVILNLALNARDAMPKGGTLTIETANITMIPQEAADDLAAGQYVVVRVSDTGLGMSEDVKAKAFEPFFTTKGPGLGSGLGLSQVYGLARQSGGGVRIDSVAGNGTSVSVFLPRAHGLLDGADLGQRQAAPDVTAGARILLVDDDEPVRTTTAMIMEAMGYAVTDVDSGAAAMALLARGAVFDLLLTDVAMPGISGPELADRVRIDRPNLPIVFFTGYADPDAIAGRHILQRLVRKPFRAADLALQIEDALAEERARSAVSG